jgi:tRNA(fMet)-specific endonuclease VapC
MVKRIAIDTNVAIAILNNQLTVIELLKKFQVVCLPVTVCGELFYGAKNSGLSAKNEKRYLAFIETCEILDNHLLVAQTYAEIRLQLKKKGTPIPENDIWIAAACKVNNLPLMTFDKHFKSIEKLKLVLSI